MTNKFGFNANKVKTQTSDGFMIGINQLMNRNRRAQNDAQVERNRYSPAKVVGSMVRQVVAPRPTVADGLRLQATVKKMQTIRKGVKDFVTGSKK